MSTFELNGCKYEVARLPVKASLRGLKLVSKVLLPALGDAVNAPEGEIGDAFVKVVEGLDCLPDLLDLFAPVTKFTGPTGKQTGLEAFVEDQFGGRPDLCVEYLARAVQGEFGGFLARPDVKGLLQQLAAKVQPASA